MRNFVVFLFAFLIVSVISFGVAASVHTQVLTTEEKRLEDARNFRIWHGSIPDYEKRLYDRIKRISKRTGRIQNLVVWSFVLLLFFNGVFLILIYRRLGTGGTPAATRPATKPATKPTAIGGFFPMVRNLTLNIIRIIRKSLPPVVIAPDETPASGSEDSNPSLR